MTAERANSRRGRVPNVWLTSLFVVILGTLLGVTQAYAQKGLTQRVWLHELVNSLPWSFGLPDEPEDADYLRMVSGNRSFLLEAEEARRPDDLVAVQSFLTFGQFSGEGWISAPSQGATAHLDYLLPLSGTYRVYATLRLKGHRIRIGDAEFTVDGGHRFQELFLGTVTLQGGPLTVEVDMPQAAAIDAVRLEAESLPPVQPFGGWSLDASLSRSDLAVTALKVLQAEALLPLSGRKLRVEAEKVRDSGLVLLTDRLFGAPSGGKWLRAGNQKVSFALPVQVPRSAYYTLICRGLAQQPVEVVVDGRYRRTLNFPDTLSEQTLGSFSLAEGEHQISFELPPQGGIDVVYLLEHRSQGEDYRTVIGLPDDDSAPSPGEVNRLLVLLAAMADTRR